MHLDLQKKYEYFSKKKEESKSTTSQLKCNFCDFKASRINVIILHTKSHYVPKKSGTEIDKARVGSRNNDENNETKESPETKDGEYDADTADMPSPDTPGGAAGEMTNGEKAAGKTPTTAKSTAGCCIDLFAMCTASSTYCFSDETINNTDETPA